MKTIRIKLPEYTVEISSDRTVFILDDHEEERIFLRFEDIAEINRAIQEIGGA